jgi:hypothetical protein
MIFKLFQQLLTVFNKEIKKIRFFRQITKIKKILQREVVKTTFSVAANGYRFLIC